MVQPARADVGIGPYRRIRFFQTVSVGVLAAFGGEILVAAAFFVFFAAAARARVIRANLDLLDDRLAADGLVEEVPNKGVTVKRYSARDMEEIYEMRVMMENEAIDHLTRAKLAPMEEELTSLLARMKLAYQRRDMPDYITMDSQLHRMLVRGSGNALLFQLYDRIDTLIRQFRRFSLVDPVRQADSVVEHETILQMLLQGNNDAAKEENKRHLLLARDQVVAYLNSLPEE